jgi:hypothetical protein
MSTSYFMVYKRGIRPTISIRHPTEQFGFQLQAKQRTDSMATSISYLVIGGAGAQGLPVVKGTPFSTPSIG